MKKVETKNYTYANENQQLYHNIINVPTSCFNPYASIFAGTSDEGRIGREIIPVGWKIRLWLANKADRNNLIYRIIIGTAPRLIGTSPITQPIIRDNVLDIDMTYGSTGNKLLFPTSTSKFGFRILKDKFITTNGNYDLWNNGKERHMLRSFYIRMKRASKVKFDTSGYNINRPFFVCILAYDSYATAETDNVASYAIYSKVYWKDP